MQSWFSNIEHRYECFKYAANRIVSIKYPTGQGDRWFRGVHINNTYAIEEIEEKFGSGKYNMYVSAFTFNWKAFNKENELSPSIKDKSYYQWFQNTLVPNMGKYIDNKDIVFEVDHREDRPFKIAGRVTDMISNRLAKKGYRHHILFSGSHGYHTIIEDGKKVAKELGISLYAPTSLRALSFIAIESTKKLLDEFFDAPIVDQKGRGRNYKDVDIHFSPMFPQGLRKAAYSLTDKGTVVLPVDIKNLNTESPDEFRVANVLAKYKIKNRGILYR